MNRDQHLPSPDVVDWLLDQEWSDAIPETTITYPKGHPDGLKQSVQFDFCTATVAIGADECCYLTLPVEALEVLKSDQRARFDDAKRAQNEAHAARATLLKQLATAAPADGEDKSGCARIELVTAIYCLASHFEIACSDLSGDDLQKARNDIAHARCIAAKHNQNGPGCAQFSSGCWGHQPTPPAEGELSPKELDHQPTLSADGGPPEVE